jgi:hypothetical protein
MSETLDPSQEAFFDALYGQDELGIVVRAHIYIEAKLLELLEVLVTNSRHLQRMNLEFEQRVHLAVALGLSEEHAPALLSLGKLRNDFAHQLDTQLSEQHANNLYEALSPSDKTTLQLIYKRMKSHMRTPSPPLFKRLEPRQRFILISLALRAKLEVAINQTGEAIGYPERGNPGSSRSGISIPRPQRASGPIPRPGAHDPSPDPARPRPRPLRRS